MATSGRAHGEARAAVEHEPVPPDAANDLAFGLELDGDLPAAIATRSGLASAPDPRAALPPEGPPGAAPGSTSLAGQGVGPLVASRFVPDSDTRRPSALPYSDPFVPSTAPWKRLVAYDAIGADFSLGVRDAGLTAVPIHEKAALDGSEEQFFGDVVVDLVADRPIRVPSVGPGARVMHARLGVGAEDIGFTLLRDSAENWFVRAHKAGRARLVYELTIPRAAFGGPFGDVPQDMRFVRWGSELPRDIERDAVTVAARIGVPRATPRETIEALVEYFRGFEESNAPLLNDRSVYLALAMSKQGVCRHRAYAFMVTAQAVGIRSRVVMNEAHAWVEVWDGRLWKRVDLGGAGTILDEPEKTTAPPYAPPPDPFKWPAGARRGDDLGRTGAGTSSDTSDMSVPGGATPTSARAATSTTPAFPPDGRPSSSVTLETTEASAARGEAVHVRGEITADGLPCAQAVVTVSARSTSTGVVSRLGDLATDERGAYAGAVLVPSHVDLGDYELVATTTGNAHCGAAVSR
jgi:transglutaminase-like putative cysteine protease